MSWPEVEQARSERRHELKLSGAEVTRRLLGGGGGGAGLDPALYALRHLNLLNISDTALAARHLACTPGLAALDNLTSLLLYGNRLDEFPPGVTCLGKLKVLDLSRNQLASVPNSINLLKELTHVNFSSNQIEELPKFEEFPALISFDCSINKLRAFPDVEAAAWPHLSDLKLNGNAIEGIPGYVAKNLPALKNFDVGDNQITVVPGEVAGLLKLKEINLKGNKLADKRLMKLVDQCRTKQVLDYVREHCPKSDSAPTTGGGGKKGKKGQKKVEDTPTEDDVCDLCHSMKILHVADEVPNVKIQEALVSSVRPHILCCIVKDLSFTEESFKKFIQLQTKLHDTICDKRNYATIATHDLSKIAPGDLLYTARNPSKLVLTPLMRQKTFTGEQLFQQLRAEAEALRKEKKRNVYSGIHKYLYLLEGKPKYPCLQDSSGKVISFPPITNSEDTKMNHETKNMFIEVTSHSSVGACKNVMDKLLQEFLLLGIGDEAESATPGYHSLTVQQVKIVDLDGNLKAVYPSRTDCVYEGTPAVKVVRVGGGKK